MLKILSVRAIRWYKNKFQHIDSPKICFKEWDGGKFSKFPIYSDRPLVMSVICANTHTHMHPYLHIIYDEVPGVASAIT